MSKYCWTVVLEDEVEADSIEEAEDQVYKLVHRLPYQVTTWDVWSDEVYE